MSNFQLQIRLISQSSFDWIFFFPILLMHLLHFDCATCSWKSLWEEEREREKEKRKLHWLLLASICSTVQVIAYFFLFLLFFVFFSLLSFLLLSFLTAAASASAAKRILAYYLSAWPEMHSIIRIRIRRKKRFSERTSQLADGWNLIPHSLVVKVEAQSMWSDTYTHIALQV